jgi:hypothetical protein
MRPVPPKVQDNTTSSRKPSGSGRGLGSSAEAACKQRHLDEEVDAWGSTL